MSTQFSSDQLAPHNVEAEAAVLGSILIAPDTMAETDVLSAGDFFIERNGWIFSALQRLHSRRDPIDYLTLVAELETSGQLSEVGGAAYILKLINETPSAINVEGYAEIVYRMAIRRRLLLAAGMIAQAAHSSEPEIEVIVATAEDAVHSVTRGRRLQSIQTMKSAMAEHFDLMQRTAAGGDLPGMGSGLTDLDRMFRARAGDLVYVAARPGMGKTAFLQTMIANNRTKPAGFLSMEMSTDQVAQRWVSSETGIPFEAMSNGTMTPEQWEIYADVYPQIAEWPVVIDDTGRITPSDLRSRVQRMVYEYSIEVVYLDFIQLMTAGGKSDDNRAQELSAISRECKLIAREFNIPFIVASQLNRNLESRADRRPLLSDMKDSGSLEQDADEVIFIYREDYYPNPGEERRGVAEIIVAKNRNGATGFVDTVWQPQRMRFVNAYKRHVDLNDTSVGTYANATRLEGR